MSVVAGEIVGRREEVSTLESALDRAEALPYAVVLHGEAGIGKTTLWHAGVEAAGSRGYRILAAAPTATEGGLAFAAVGDLLGPLADDALPSLPPPQRRALAVALLLEDPGGQPPDPRTLGVAVLGVLRALAEETSVLLAVDDVQWLDPASAAGLEFACRRLSDERVALLLAFRDEPGEPEPRLAHALAPERLETLQVGPMSIGALHELLRQRLGRSYSRPLLRGSGRRPAATRSSPSSSLEPSSSCRDPRQQASRYRSRLSSTPCLRVGSPTSLPPLSRSSELQPPSAGRRSGSWRRRPGAMPVPRYGLRSRRSW